MKLLGQKPPLASLVLAARISSISGWACAEQKTNFGLSASLQALLIQFLSGQFMTKAIFRRVLFYTWLAAHYAVFLPAALAAPENGKSATMASLLSEAENGDLDAVKNVAAGGKLVFPDGGMSSYIPLHDERFISIRNSISLEEALTAIGFYYVYGLIGESSEKARSIESCVWLFRATRFRGDQMTISHGKVEDLGAQQDKSECLGARLTREESMICYQDIQRAEMARSIYESLADDDRKKCGIRAVRWRETDVHE